MKARVTLEVGAIMAVRAVAEVEALHQAHQATVVVEVVPQEDSLNITIQSI